jgi:hypothetical protein
VHSIDKRQNVLNIHSAHHLCYLSLCIFTSDKDLIKHIGVVSHRLFSIKQSALFQMDVLSTFILNERFWLPANTTWKDFTRLEREENIKLTSPNDLLYVFPLAGVIYVIRVLFER